jgi:ABC-type glutathione transport system ATPase component
LCDGLDVVEIGDRRIELEYKTQKLDLLISDGDTVARYQTYLTNLEKYNATRLRISEIEDKEHDTLSRIEALNHLLASISKCQNIAISAGVDDINAHAKAYLDLFFDEPISARLSSFKKGKPTINLEIFYKSTSDYTIADLSGGDYDRVVLAFTLALAELSNPNLVLLDECISSLDHHTCVEVVQTIREQFGGNVVFIAHQVSTGIFDNVVNI